MSKGRFSKKSKKNTYIWLIAVLSLVLVGLLVFVWNMENSAPEHDESVINQTESGTPSEQGSQIQTSPETIQGTEGDSEETSSPQTETPTVQQTEAPMSQQTEAPAPQQTEAPAPLQTEPSTATTEPVVVTQPPVEIEEQVAADYERWLAAAMLVSISMEHPDFEITGIYLASETTMPNKAVSKGCYILFTSLGEEKAIYSKPLSAERTEAGTTDISSQILGYASFDSVDPAGVDTSSMTLIDMSELGDLIAQSMLVSIYYH